MSWLSLVPLSQFLAFALVLTRISGLVMLAPIYGTQEIPMRIRSLLAVGLAALIAPGVWSSEWIAPRTLPELGVLIAGELAIGLCLGLGLMILFSGIQLAGQVVSQTSGLALADVFNPSLETEIPLFAQLFHLVAMAVYVTIGGHRMAMGALLDTFATIPVGGGGFGPSMVEAFNTLAMQSFSLGVRAAAPALAALILASLVLGLIGRTLPQLNVLALGFGLNAMVALGVLALSLGAAMWAFELQIEPAVETLVNAVGED